LAEQMYQKMRARSRELYPKEVVLGSNRPDSLFNRADWLQVYQPLTPGPSRSAPLRHGSGVLTTHQNPFSITATFSKPNRIDIIAKNVESIRIHLNDQMVDLKDAVTVSFNGRVRFEDPVKMSLEEMLLDQLYLGRGWRYYTAFADIDFGAPKTQPFSTISPAKN
jgi:hypothetical protein